MPFAPKERAEAMRNGLTRYYTGKPCPQGHLSERSTSNGNCMECAKARSSKRWHANADENRRKSRQRYADNREALVQKAIDYRLQNPDKVKTSNEKWRKANRHKKAASQMRRFASKLKATPSWLSKSQQLDIAAFYAKAGEMSLAYGANIQVDHIVPLKGENICGLHVPWNLQLVTRSYNCSKNNRLSDIPEGIVKPGCVLVHHSALPWNLKETKDGDHI